MPEPVLPRWSCTWNASGVLAVRWCRANSLCSPMVDGVLRDVERVERLAHYAARVRRAHLHACDRVQQRLDRDALRTRVLRHAAAGGRPCDIARDDQQRRALEARRGDPGHGIRHAGSRGDHHRRHAPCCACPVKMSRNPHEATWRTKAYSCIAPRIRSAGLTKSARGGRCTGRSSRTRCALAARASRTCRTPRRASTTRSRGTPPWRSPRPCAARGS
jgi:hypothetical protein